MKKSLIIVLPLLVVMPGCLFKKNTQVKKSISIHSPSRSELMNDTALEIMPEVDIEEFVLQDELGKDLFDSKSSTIPLEDAIEKTVIQQRGRAIQFDYDSIKIRPSEAEKLYNNVQIVLDALRKDKKSILLVEGHSCKIAVNPDYNHVLSYERAQTIADRYAEEGVPRDRMRVIGRGCTQILTDAEGKEAQAPNRRVETQIMSTQE